MTDDGYLNEKHMSAIERSLLKISDTRKKLNAACADLTSSKADEYLLDALKQADRDLELAYKKLFQNTYFHVSDEQMANAGKSRAAASDRSKK